jgi:hypothetical protein
VEVVADGGPAVLLVSTHPGVRCGLVDFPGDAVDGDRSTVATLCIEGEGHLLDGAWFLRDRCGCRGGANGVGRGGFQLSHGEVGEGSNVLEIEVAVGLDREDRDDTASVQGHDPGARARFELG